MLNPRVCGDALLANNIEKKYKGRDCTSQKITVDLTYLRSERSTALTLKQNFAKWYKN